MSATTCVVGIAVATAHRDMALRPPVMVLEATGGDQLAVVAALAAAQLPVAVVHPRHGQLAQTAVLDARVWAHVAEAVRPTPRPLADAPDDARRALLARRRPRVARRTAAQHRLGSVPSRLRPDIQAQITGPHERLARLDDALDTTRRASPVGRARGPQGRPPRSLSRPAGASG